MVEEEVDLHEVKSRAVKGMATLTGGGVILTLISGFGVLLLTTYLGPSEFGLYGLVASIIVILGYFSDVGLAASLIQKKETPTKQDLQTTFTVQQVLVILSITVALIVSPLVKANYGFGATEYGLFLALLLSFFLSSLKTVPSVMLERSLRFDLIMIVRIIEALAFNIIAVTLAFKGMGVASYIPAVVGQSVVGLVLIYIFKPWPIGLSFSKENLHKLLRFGVPYQLNSLLAVAKDQFTNLWLYKIVGTAGMGFINWGFYYSQLPQRLIMDNVTKVAFPTLSRLQDHPEDFKRSVERMMQFICLIIFPMLIGIGLVWSHMAYLVPKWFKWQQALVPLYLFCFSALMSCLSTPLTNTLYALGKAKINTYLMIMWLALEWAIKPYLAVKLGFIGIAYGAAFISLSSFVPFIIAKKIIGFSVIKSLGVVTVASVLMALVGIYMHRFGLMWTVIVASVTYCGIVAILGGKRLLTDIKPFYAYFLHKI